MRETSDAIIDSRKAVLESLLACQGDLGRIAQRLRTFPWDSDELVTLTVDHIQSVLERYVGGELSAAEVEHWADLIECRDDISYDETIKELISELANPVLSGRLNVLKAQSLLVRLRKLQQSKSR